jgi:S1-C subfamily serine protease
MATPFSFDTNLLDWIMRSAPSATRLGQAAPHKKIEDPIKVIIQEAIAAACMIYVSAPSGQWTGSGFHVGGGIIATAGHVVPQELASSPAQITVTFDSKTLYPAQFLVTDPESDSGLLMCAPIARQIKPVLLGDSDSAEVGDIIAVVSSPEGWRDTATVGRISNIHQDLGPNAPSKAWRNILFIDADILEGSSGGLVIGTDGLAVGSVMGVTGEHAELGLGERAVCPSNKISRLIDGIQRAQ